MFRKEFKDPNKPDKPKNLKLRKDDMNLVLK